MDHLRVDRPSEGVVLLTLDNPDQRNAMSDAMTDAWEETITSLSHDPSARCVVFTGAGSAFCAGGNPAWIAGDPDASVDELRTRMIGFYRRWLSVRRLEVPTIAAVNGWAVGAGMCIALAADIRYGSTEAKMSVPFVKLGLHPGMAATFLLPDVVGPARARELLLTGRAVHADEALQMGLLSRVLPAETFLDDVLATAAEIAGTAPIASKLTKVALHDGGHANTEAAIQWEALAQPITLATADLQEGIAASLEKRAPRFVGR